MKKQLNNNSSYILDDDIPSVEFSKADESPEIKKEKNKIFKNKLNTYFNDIKKQLG